MYWTGRRLARGRRDGRLVQDLPALRSVMPALMRTRLEGTIYYAQHLDVEHLMDWLDRINGGRPEAERIRFFHVFLTAFARLYRVRPELNRFVSGGRTYEHHDITFSFTVKQALTDEAQEVQSSIVFSGTETVDEVRGIVERELGRARNSDDSASDHLVATLGRLPAPVLAGVARVVWALDGVNLLPRFLQEAIPVYASAYLVNLGSLGAEAPFHHLYQHGTTSVFCAVGTIRPQPVVDDSGEITVRRRVDVVYTVDERVTDGFYLVRSSEVLQQMMDDPQALLRRPPEGPEQV
ncbi:2-oxo acid dehydrogenase subunit E2 [Ornithinimicrobium flavum]|uniref:2-oxo acid dehydrogenase subunit E2 n=1 Tax=Ornithinimicrobium flavum TaxID=1288636 RepID=UPI00106F65C6|nr:2-oxo acid dehydrogenase subunit E2 [Ornithinimicrobium flavum]